MTNTPGAGQTDPPGGDRPRVGVSACLLGLEVRHDGGHKRDGFVAGELARIADLVSVCPEVELGMGVPREPVRMVQVDGRVRMRGVDSGHDHTDAMEAWAAHRIRALAALDLDGYIFKQDSPSCGLHQVKLFPETTGTPQPIGRGLFAAALCRALPLLAVEEEGRLRETSVREAFMNRVHAHARLRRDR